MATPAITDSWYATAIAAATLSPFARVLIDSAGKLAVAGATDRASGYLTERGSVISEPATYRRAGAPEQIAIANAALEIGDLLYAAASGKVDDADAGGAVVVGRATSTATAADQLVTFVPVE